MWVRLQAGARGLFILQSAQTGSKAHPTTYRVPGGIVVGFVKLATPLDLVPRLGMHGDVPPLSHSLHGVVYNEEQGQYLSIVYELCSVLSLYRNDPGTCVKRKSKFNGNMFRFFCISLKANCIVCVCVIRKLRPIILIIAAFK
jgi:hypothetical protein